ncbi:hypothetical protein METBIDRAFT_33625 [Metschnikowia bicuspidata var. bicuspidata NRRL YB-4993]|uniref:VLRF1 domain-containing protein n=1 Tax=Metschnikowia bicuspidata var. bicuspidata NRRL YB-4993 TaxID=869754 RepID=A0A1A0H4Z7_9ASCO|nr:hypothetical protein METBIDRAFT_33625 [Metschnikowia bicuspidata var. bicuspidata NRRL YB-4993]OBA18998.1 hypothetical protein METBIDRAFT_33625 [Metschnikowia bicuspidata var. bicuspidata NRRL YB-4993]
MNMNKDEHYIFDLKPDLLDSLQLLHFDESLSVVDVAPVKVAEQISETQTATKVKDLSECLTCKLEFSSDATQKERNRHYKSDIHRLNLKRSLNGLVPLTEAEFEEFLETQSVESISGSEDSDSDSDIEFEQRLPTVFEKLSVNENKMEELEESHASHMNTHSPFVILKSSKLESSKGFGAYKALFDNTTLSNGDIVEKLKSYNSAKSKQGISVLLMIGGGHFAGAVISHKLANTKGNIKNHKESLQAQRVTVLELKTFHRYTTRRKQGGSQSASDNARGKANSAGSSIRRYNEQALKKDVHDLLSSWKSYLTQAEHIFIRANGTDSRKTLMGYEGSILNQDDPRVKSFPFTTKRATLGEVKNSWVKLTYLSVLDLPKAKTIVEKQTKEEKKLKTPEPAEEPDSDKHSREVVALLKKSKAPLLVNYMKSNDLDINFILTPESRYGHTPTPLHYAAWQGLQRMVKLLLMNMKADPTMYNISGKTAYQVSTSKDIKSVFQICRHNLGEDYCNWDLAKVGPPKSSELVAAENAKEKEAQKAENRRLIEEELAKKTDLEMKRPTVQSSGRVGGEKVFTSVAETSGLTDQQKMRLMREQRARAAEARMKRGGQ